jgi:chemotaxis protein CheD
MTKKIAVGMAEFEVVHNPCTLEAFGLGACVAICLRDEKTKIASLAHVMLSDSKEAPTEVNPLRFVDKAVDAMLGSMLALGCRKSDITAKLCGGAEIFPGVSHLSGMGTMNIDAARKKLAAEGIKIVAEDVGGTCGRSMCFNTETGDVIIRRIRCKETQI